MADSRNKGIRSKWSNDELKLAINDVKIGVSICEASRRHNIARRTLKRYLDKNIGHKQNMGRKTVLNNEQENELSNRVIRLAEIGYPLTNQILRKCVYQYCEKNSLPHVFSKEKKMAGRYWMKGFLQRHSEISKRRAQSMNPARAQKLNKFIVNDYFEKLKTVIEELDLMDKPERIFNVDEKGCRLSLHHQQTVLAKKGAKRVHLVAPEHGENVTIVACANASGIPIPPAILFKGLRMKPEWKDNLPHGSLVLMTPKGSMNVETFILWLKHLAKYKLQGKCLLIFDGASCHLDYSILEAAEQYDISLLCLPSNTTHELQPMDKSVFRSFEHNWDEQVLLFWMQHKDRKLTKQRFGPIFSAVWDKTMTPANIKSGFAATGIFPYNPEAIPEIAYAPSILTESKEKSLTSARRETSSPIPGCSYSIKSETCKIRVPRKKGHKKNVVDYDTSSNSSIDYTSESENSDQEFDQSSRQDVENVPPKINESFSEMLDTPEKTEQTNKTRKKSINSRAVLIKRDVFPNNKKKSTQEKSKVAKGNWYCEICDTNSIKDMRLCSVCAVYVHEECVGLTKYDKEIFVCPNCS